MVTVRGPADLETVHLSTNHGTLGQVLRVSPGLFEAEYRPPPQLFPRVAVFAAWGRSEQGVVHGVASLPLWGAGAARVTTRPHTTVTLQVGARAFGPVESDAAGLAVVQVQVPPGTTSVQHGARAIDLHLPSVSRLHVVAIPEVLIPDVEAEVTLRVYAVSPAGQLERADAQLTVPIGTVGPLVWRGPGVAEAVWRLPAMDPATRVQASGAIVGDQAAPATATLQISPRLLARLEFDPVNDGFVAGQAHPLELLLQLRDEKGRPAEAEVHLSSDEGVLGPPVLIEPGQLRVRLELPNRFGGRRAVTVSAVCGDLRAQTTLALIPGAPTELALDSAGPVRARETVVFRGAALDAFGNPVAVVPSARGPVAITPSDGGFEVHFTAPATRTATRVEFEVEVAGLKRRQHIEVVPAPGWLTAGVKAGIATNFALIAAPAGAIEVGGWAQVATWRVGLLLDAGALIASYEAAVDPPPSTLRGNTTFVPILFSVAVELDAHPRLWLRPAVGIGFSGIFQRVQLGELPGLMQSGTGPAAQLSLQVGVRAPFGGPVLELRGLWVGNPGLALLRGSLFSLVAMLGYSFDVL